MTASVKCLKCGREMEEGFILDSTHSGAPGGGPVYFAQAKWVAGKPEGSIWSGVKWNDKEAYKIAAYRCPNCGLLELHGEEPTKYPETP